MMTLLNTTPSLSKIKVCPHALDSPDPPHAKQRACLPTSPLQDLCLTNCKLRSQSKEAALLDQTGSHFVLLHPQQPVHRTWTLAGTWVE